jgi:uncharacterized protein
VGVDLNTASWALLRYVAGIGERTALNIVAYRDKNGRFVSREQLKQVTGVGPKTFEQAAGFLRIRGGVNPLDSTAVHPESYALVEQIARIAGSPVEGLIQQPDLLKKVDAGQLKAGAFTLADILEELRKPGRDPRDKFVAPSFLESVHEISDLEPGMVLEGVVTNVTRFGAFVDVGVHQDGLVHISELSNKFLKDPSEAVKAGQIVKVKVLSADARTKRVSLSIKALLEAAPRVGKRPDAAAGQAPGGNAAPKQGCAEPGEFAGEGCRAAGCCSAADDGRQDCGAGGALGQAMRVRCDRSSEAGVLSRKFVAVFGG